MQELPEQRRKAYRESVHGAHPKLHVVWRAVKVHPQRKDKSPAGCYSGYGSQGLDHQLLRPDAKGIRHAEGPEYLFKTDGDRRACIRKHHGNQKAEHVYSAGKEEGE